MKLSPILLFICALFCSSIVAQNHSSLVPDKVSQAPDYFCTWNVQGYLCSYKSGNDQRAELKEANMFGNSTFQNWLDFYPKIRADIFFVMDDSWDIPLNGSGDYFGLLELNQERFPSYTGSPEEKLNKLVSAVKAKGWKGLGGWICAQEAAVADKTDTVNYWKERLKIAEKSGFAYWKVDWGKRQGSGEFRKMLTELGHKYAPELVIEHAMNESFISFSDAYRTYDVENVISLPVSISRVAGLLKYKAEKGAKGIINCEDEPYIAAGLGCAIGIMRHPFYGALPNGIPDFAFPAVGRDIKKRLDEVVRAVRWHRIAEPFGVGKNTAIIDTVKNTDSWKLERYETWVDRKPGDILQEKAPARVSRGLPLAKISNPGKYKPYVLSSLYPNGAIAIATIGRTVEREYLLEKAIVEQEIKSIDYPIGIFGQYESLTLILPDKIKKSDYTIWGQDLACDSPVNITKEISIQGNRIIIPGDLISKIGLSASSTGDLSDPGMVLKFEKK
jgi:hypothetical protein